MSWFGRGAGMASDYVVDSSIALKWLLDDESDTQLARDILMKYFLQESG